MTEPPSLHPAHCRCRKCQPPKQIRFPIADLAVVALLAAALLAAIGVAAGLPEALYSYEGF